MVAGIRLPLSIVSVPFGLGAQGSSVSVGRAVE